MIHASICNLLPEMFVDVIGEQQQHLAVGRRPSSSLNLLGQVFNAVSLAQHVQCLDEG